MKSFYFSGMVGVEIRVGLESLTLTYSLTLLTALSLDAANLGLINDLLFINRMGGPYSDILSPRF